MKAMYAFLACLLCATAQAEPPAVQHVFERVFGDAIRLDPDMCRQVREGEPGKRHYLDNDGDGNPEEVWFIDLALRHPEPWRPLLVRVIDEDGDLEMGFEPDLDSDLYVADWNADGTVDAVCDYTDEDGDQDVDEMALFFPGKSGGAPADGLMVWWGYDAGDDNLLWYDIGYTYRQPLCQYRTHFGGNEYFNAYTLNMDDSEWVCLFENPFVFYDLDDDGVTEEVIRISGRNESVDNLRYSFDADDDATPDSPRDFDVSISAHAPKELTFGEDLSERRMLRGIRTGPFLGYDKVRAFCQAQTWADMLLCWDENDLNMDGHNLSDGRFADTQERWEGIIAKGTEAFAQIGGPNCGPFNKRYELATHPRDPIRVYYCPTDQRLHLFGADALWIEVDLDYDQKPDMRYDMTDKNGDGYVDAWQVDIDGDGTPDDAWTRGDAPVRDVPYAWADVRDIMKPLLAEVPEAFYGLNQRLREALAKCSTDASDPVQTLLESGFDAPGLTEELRLRLIASAEARRYYLDLWKDRLIARLKTAHRDAAFWTAFDAARSRGDIEAMRGALETTFGLSEPLTKLDDWAAAALARFDRPRVAWAQDWIPPNIGWESEVCGYRAYWGQFDFFGKSKPCLVMKTFGPAYSYHVEQDWGMDALHVGACGGLGGATLYVNGTPYPVWCPEGKGPIEWSKRLVSETRWVVVVELKAEKVGPEAVPYTVTFRCSALAGRKDSPIEVTVDGGAPEDALELGIGLMKLAQESAVHDPDAGVLAAWGCQQDAIGYVGLGLVYPKEAFLRYADLPEERQIVLRIERGKPVRYNIQGDWLNGRRFPRCPTLANWLNDLRNTARIAALP